MYDSPSKFLLYPHGYRHDLALIYGPDLPEICPPPNVNMVPEWASYEDVLQGSPVFATALNVQFNRWKKLEGTIASKGVEKAVVEGMDYFWDRETMSSSAGIIWRTTNDSLCAGGWSGSVLCLGTPVEGKPLVFQNYEHKFDKWPAGEGPEQTTPTDFVKGGFLLPTDIRNAKILFGPGGTRREVNSEPPTFPGATVTRASRKEFSAP